MADLDDFFAKKDRKKSKSVKKFATADELAKKMEDTKQKTDVRPKKERPAQEGEETGRGPEEEEWKEYEEPVKDYTGLKIQVLQGSAGAPESGRDPSTEDSMPDNPKNKGPWNKPTNKIQAGIKGTEAEAVEQAAVARPPPPPVEEKARAPAAYVPPQSRQRPCDGPVRRPQNKNPLDIHNEDYFPVLGAGAKRGGGWSTAGGGATQRPQAHSQPLALGNRFTSLQDDS